MRGKIVGIVILVIGAIGFLASSLIIPQFSAKKEYTNAMAFPPAEELTVSLKKYSTGEEKQLENTAEVQALLDEMQALEYDSAKAETQAILPEDNAYSIILTGGGYDCTFVVADAADQNYIYGATITVNLENSDEVVAWLDNLFAA